MSTSRNGQSTGLDRLPPNNREAERALLGRVLRDNGNLDEVAVRLQPEDFYVFGHQCVFECMLLLRGEGKQIDYITLPPELERRGWLDDAGGHAYLVNLWDAAPASSGNVRQYAESIREKAMLRQLIELAHDTSRNAFSPGAVLDDLLTQVDRRLGAIAGRVYAGQVVTQAEAVDASLGDLDSRRRRADDERAPGAPIKTGWCGLDELIAGLYPTELITVGARPSVGKTLFAVNLMRNVARRDLPVFFVSLEQPVRELVGRELAAEAHVKSRRLREPSLLNIDERGRILDAADRLRPLPIWYDDEPYQSMFRIAATARRFKRQHGIRLLIVDYVQLVQPESRREQRHEQIGAITRRLKLLARELEIPIVAMAQVSRAAEDRPDARPRMADLRESGNLEQDSDNVLLLHKSKHTDASGDVDMLTVIVDKCRNGPIGDVPLVHDKQYCDIRDWAGPEPPASQR